MLGAEKMTSPFPVAVGTGIGDAVTTGEAVGTGDAVAVGDAVAAGDAVAGDVVAAAGDAVAKIGSEGDPPLCERPETIDERATNATAA